MSKKNKHHGHVSYALTKSSYGVLGGMVLSIIACNITLIGWVKIDTQRDIDGVKSEISRMRDDTNAFKFEVRGWREELHKQNSDYNARLSVIEDRQKRVNHD